jgi:hypothetical protein
VVVVVLFGVDAVVVGDDVVAVVVEADDPWPDEHPASTTAAQTQAMTGSTR